MVGGPAVPGARCFLAVAPPDRLVRVLRSMERPDRTGLRWTAEEQWHVTVAFFAEVDPDGLLSALDSWSGSPPGPPPARATSGPRPRSLGGRVWILPVAGLDVLAGAVEGATTHVEGRSARGGERPFRGHLTLARARHPGVLRGLPAPEICVSWQVTEVVAFRSHLGRGGAEHEVIGRWRLPTGTEDRAVGTAR